MTSYLIRRVGIGLVTLLLITFLIYGLIRAMPGTPMTADPANLDPSRQLSPEAMESLKRQYGLHLPWYQAYFVWLGNLLQGDLGESIAAKNNGIKVATLIANKAPATLLLSGSSLVLTYLFAIPLGLWSSAKADTPAERVSSTLLYMLYSLPSFVAALYLQLLFYVKLDWLPLYGMHSNGYESFTSGEYALDLLKHSVLPITCFTYGSLAYYSRFIRANMQEVTRQDFIRTAKAKGVPPWRVVWTHAFRNTLIPLVTLMGLTLPSLLSGAVILEQIFAWPGMGGLFFTAIGERDYPVIMGLTLMFSVLTLVGQLLADVLYAVVDPRVSYH